MGSQKRESCPLLGANRSLTLQFKLMKLLTLPLLLFASIICVSAQSEILHPWTDSQGRTLQASFISLDSEKVTIKWNGQVVPIPLVSLSPESQNLAKQLASQMNSGATAGSPAKINCTLGRMYKEELFRLVL